MTPILTIAIATTAARFAGIALRQLPVLDGVAYHIFVQAAELPACPTALARADIAISQSEGTGAARNRNAALAAVTSPFMLFADDDLDFEAAGLRDLIDRFNAAPELDFLCARLADETGAPRKRYSPDRATVRWWNCAKAGTPELAIRPEAFRRAGVGFDVRFGAGTAAHLGDEYIFLCDALRAGLRGAHVAPVVARHLKESSGTSETASAMTVRKAVLIRALGRAKSWPARCAFALRHRTRFQTGRELLFFLLP